MDTERRLPVGPTGPHPLSSAERPSSSSYNLLWLSLALLPLVALAFMLPIPAQDYWWYLRLGQDILKAGAIPAVDTMSYSRAGQAVFYQPWLAALILLRVYELGGVTLTLLVRGLLIGVTFGMIWEMCRRESGPRLATLLVILVGLASTNNWVMRPQLFAYPLFVISLFALKRWQAGHNQTLWVLPVSALLAANLHGSFILLFALAGAALLVGKGNRSLLLAALLSMLVATLLNPHAARIWLYPFEMINSPADYRFSVEWFPPSNAGWQMNLFFGWLLAFPLLVALSPRKLSALEWAWFLVFGWLALSGIRYVIWFLFLLAVESASLLSKWTQARLDKPLEKVRPAQNIALACLIFILPASLLPVFRASYKIQSPPVYETSTTPIAAVRWLSQHPELAGPIFNDYAFGSYLAFALPERPTWIDTRIFNFPPAQWEKYVAISGASLGWQSELDQAGINLLLLSTAAQQPLIEAAGVSGAWCEMYRDEAAVIFSRCAGLP